MKTIKRPKNWVKADAVRVRRVGGKTVVEIRRKKKRNPPKKRNSPTGRKKATAILLKKYLETGRYANRGRIPNLAGFVDGEGKFHPIRGTKGYSGKKAGDPQTKRKATRQRKTKKKGRR